MRRIPGALHALVLCGSLVSRGVGALRAVSALERQPA